MLVFVRLTKGAGGDQEQERRRGKVETMAGERQQMKHAPLVLGSTVVGCSSRWRRRIIFRKPRGSVVVHAAGDMRNR